MRPFVITNPHTGERLRRTLSGGYVPIENENDNYWKPAPNTTAKMRRRKRGKMAKASRKINRP